MDKMKRGRAGSVRWWCVGWVTVMESCVRGVRSGRLLGGGVWWNVAECGGVRGGVVWWNGVE